MRREPTPAWDSGNYTVWEDYVDIAFAVVNCFTLLITFFVGLAANIFVTFAVYRQKSLQTWNNALLVNLAVIDILRCAIDCPVLFTIVITVYQRGYVAEVICDTQVASFSFSCCIQMLTLACISAERHQAIAQPSKFSQQKKRIIVFIPLTWTLAIIVAAFCVTYVKDSPVYVKCKGSQWETTSSYDTFGLYIVIPLWATCFSVIIGFYARIFTLVRSHNRKIFDKGTVAVSKKEKIKDAAEQKKEDTAVVDSQHKKAEQSETLKQSVAHTEQVTHAEPNPSKTDSTTVPLTSTKESESVVVGSENKNVLQNSAKTTELGTEPPPPPVVQIKPKSPDKDAAADLKVSVIEPQGISEKVNDRSEPEDKTQTDDAPSRMEQQLGPKAMQIKPKSSNGNAMDKLKSSPTEPQQFLNKSADQSESKAAVQTNESSKPPATKAETKQTSKGDGAEKPQNISSNKVQFEEKVQTNEEPSGTKERPPEGCSVLPKDPKEVKNDGGETLAVAAKDQLCSLPRVSSNVPQTEAPQANVEMTGAVCMRPSGASKERANKKKESKMAKRSGYIILTFLLFWLPLITTILVNFAVYKNKSTQVRVFVCTSLYSQLIILRRIFTFSRPCDFNLRSQNCRDPSNYVRVDVNLSVSYFCVIFLREMANFKSISHISVEIYIRSDKSYPKIQNPNPVPSSHQSEISA